MPIYDFTCCGEKIEVIQSADKEAPLCQVCGSKMEKLFTSPALIVIKDGAGTRSYPRGYKEDYYKDYQRRLQESKS